ncbi:hypothetical protein B0H17DRAFT_1180856 [Mycena rosella]|uniref:Uncharacterized protein n=1 Tax=Mycena rosella TaxID=1033263 RepID=A0AAD7GC03_MYCRO|nr:hypothetical protein B0H17DRAFT_1180856 [Mycena rosella]
MSASTRYQSQDSLEQIPRLLAFGLGPGPGSRPSGTPARHICFINIIGRDKKGKARVVGACSSRPPWIWRGCASRNTTIHTLRTPIMMSASRKTDALQAAYWSVFVRGCIRSRFSTCASYSVNMRTGCKERRGVGALCSSRSPPSWRRASARPDADRDRGYTRLDRSRVRNFGLRGVLYQNQWEGLEDKEGKARVVAPPVLLAPWTCGPGGHTPGVFARTAAFGEGLKGLGGVLVLVLIMIYINRGAAAFSDGLIQMQHTRGVFARAAVFGKTTEKTHTPLGGSTQLLNSCADPAPPGVHIRLISARRGLYLSLPSLNRCGTRSWLGDVGDGNSLGLSSDSIWGRAPAPHRRIAWEWACEMWASRRSGTGGAAIESGAAGSHQAGGKSSRARRGEGGRVAVHREI